MQVQFVVVVYDGGWCEVCCFQEYGSGVVGDMGIEVVYQVGQCDWMVCVGYYQEVVVQCGVVVVEQFYGFVGV